MSEGSSELSRQSVALTEATETAVGIYDGDGRRLKDATNSAYVNAVAYDAVLQGREALGLWVHELGNSISLITRIKIPVAKDAADRYDDDTDQGTASEIVCLAVMSLSQESFGQNPKLH